MKVDCHFSIKRSDFLQMQRKKTHFTKFSKEQQKLK